MILLQNYMCCDICNEEITQSTAYLQIRTIIKGSARTQDKVKHICLNCKKKGEQTWKKKL